MILILLSFSLASAKTFTSDPLRNEVIGFRTHNPEQAREACYQGLIVKILSQYKIPFPEAAKIFFTAKYKDPYWFDDQSSHRFEISYEGELLFWGWYYWQESADSIERSEPAIFEDDRFVPQFDSTCEFSRTHEFVSGSRSLVPGKRSLAPNRVTALAGSFFHLENADGLTLLELKHTREIPEER